MLYALMVVYCFANPALHNHMIPCDFGVSHKKFYSNHVCETAGREMLATVRDRTPLRWSTIVCAEYLPLGTFEPEA